MLENHGLPLHSNYKETILRGGSKWFSYEWEGIATCHIEDKGSVVLNDYSGGGSVYTTVYGSVSSALDVLKLILTPHADPDRSKARLISQLCRHLSEQHGELILEEALSIRCRQHLEYHRFTVLQSEEAKTTVSW